jgi:YHS domain-containing protein
MKNLSSVSITMLLACLLITGISAEGIMEGQKKGQPQTICPVLGGEIDKSIYADYKGYRIYFCCSDCPDIFKKNPEKYMKILKDSGAILEKAPKGHDKGAQAEKDTHRKKHHHMQ